MDTPKTNENHAGLAVLVRGNGFVYAVLQFIENRRRRKAEQHTAEELDHLPDYLKADIAWPSVARHENR